MQWSVRPFVRIILFYVVGILLGNNLGNFEIKTFLILLLSSILFFIGFAVARWFSSYKYRWFSGVFFLLTIFLFGISNSYYKGLQMTKKENIYDLNFYVGEIVNDPIESKKSIKLELTVLGKSENSNEYSEYQIMAYVEKSEASKRLVYGDKIVLQSPLKIFTNAGNPGEFDYAIFLKRKGIVYTTYLNKDQWEYLSYSPSNKILAFAKSLRRHLLKKLQYYSYYEGTYQVAAAILLGYDNLMDVETEQDFMRAGAMHILCVSGLHVGVIFMIVSLLLNFLKSTKGGKIIRIFLLLFVVWSYALLTGMSPSVQRASVMLSFFIVGEGFSRLKDNYNTLAASAFLMLLFDPNLIYSVGFQLSYAAVIGIISIYRPLYNLLYFNNKLIDYLWSISAVSIAAQLGTFPIATHYFHYFPTYFWLVNLIIIPLSFLIIIVGFVFIIVSWIPFLSGIIGWATSFLIKCLNEIVGVVELFPFHGFDNIYMPFPKLILVYLIIFVAFQMLFSKKIIFLKYLVFLVFTLLGINTIVKYNNLNQSELVMFNVNNHDVLEFVEGTNALLLCDSAFALDENIQKFILKANHIQKGLQIKSILNFKNLHSIENSSHFVNGSFLNFNNKKYYLLSSNDSLFPVNKNKELEIDAIIISGKKRFDFFKIQECFNFKKIIISSSVPYWKQKQIEQKCREFGIECFNINVKGAYLENVF